MPEHAKLPLWADQTTTQQVETLHHLINDLYGYVLHVARERLLSILAAHLASDPKEADDIRLITEMLQRYPNLLSKNCEVGHITGSALVIDLNSGRVLLHYHKSLARWLQFGGHAEFETDPAQVALREAIEECGLPDLAFFPAMSEVVPIDVDVHLIPQTSERPEHLHLDFRYVLATTHPEAINAGSDESSQFLWIAPDQLATLSPPIDPPLARLIDKAAHYYLAAAARAKGNSA